MTAPSTTEAPSPNGELSLAEKRAAARDTYQTSLAEKRPLTGADLGRRFGQSPRWGRDRVAEVHAENGPADEPDGDWDTGRQGREDRTVSRDSQAATPEPATDSGTSNEAKVGRVVAASPNVRATERTYLSGPASSPPIDSVPAVTPAVRRISTLAVVAVALVAAVASYDHQRVLAEMAGEGWRAWMLPISVDGLVVAASMSMLVRRRAGLRTGALTWLALLAGIGASLGANVAAAEPTVVGRLVAAWPPLAFAVAFEMAMRTRAVHDHTHATEGRTRR